MDNISLNNNMPVWYDYDSNMTKIVFLNTRSLRKHFEDIRCSRLICRSDLLCISETWFHADQDPSEYILHDYKEPHLVSIGTGKGLATYAKKSFQHVEDVTNATYQITKYQNKLCDVISVYRSSNAKSEKIVSDIRKLSTSNKLTIVGGDFNICVLKNKQNVLTNGLEKLGFKQLTSEATHIAGGGIDHCYIKQPSMNSTNPHREVNVSIQPVYWSDHDAIMVLYQ